MDEFFGLRKQTEYAVGDWVLFTTGASWNRPGYVQRKEGTFDTSGKPIRYEILYRRWIPGPRTQHTDPVTICYAGQLIRVIDFELTRSEFLSLAPRDVKERYLDPYCNPEES